MFDDATDFSLMLECHSYCSIVLNMHTVIDLDYNNIPLMDDNKMLVDRMNTSMIAHWNTYSMDHNNNYSHRMIEEMVYNNIEVEELDDKMDNTWMDDGTVELDILECLLMLCS